MEKGMRTLSVITRLMAVIVEIILMKTAIKSELTCEIVEKKCMIFGSSLSKTIRKLHDIASLTFDGSS
jgi:hypothetical protein